MKKITIITRMYNPGKYVYHCVDSVLNQTFTDFRYVIVDNASSDGTKEVLEEYAKKDSRIELYRNEENNVSVLECLHTYATTEYFMILDHDDWLEENALELLLKYAEENETEIALGRTNFVTANETFLQERGYEGNVVVTPKELGENLPYFYWQLRTTWAAVIKSYLIKNIDEVTLKKIWMARYGGDTVKMLCMAFSAKKIGFIKDVIHNYRILGSSDSHTFCREHFMADWILFDLAKRCLEKHGVNNDALIAWLYKVYISAIADTIRIAVNAKVTDEIKRDVIMEVLEHPYTKEMMRYVPFGRLTGEQERNDLKKNLIGFLSSCVDAQEKKKIIEDWIRVAYAGFGFSEEDFRLIFERNDLASVFCTLNTKQSYEMLFAEGNSFGENYTNIKLQLLLYEERGVKTLATRLLSLEREEIYHTILPQITILASQNRLLADISKEICNETLKVVLRICATQYVEALNDCIGMLRQEPRGYWKIVLQIALRLAAVLEESEVFVSLKKYECDILMETQQFQEAEAVLVDLEEMCPNDSDVKELRKLFVSGK